MYTSTPAYISKSKSSCKKYLLKHTNEESVTCADFVLGLGPVWQQTRQIWVGGGGHNPPHHHKQTHFLAPLHSAKTLISWWIPLYLHNHIIDSNDLLDRPDVLIAFHYKGRSISKKSQIRFSGHSGGILVFNKLDGCCNHGQASTSMSLLVSCVKWQGVETGNRGERNKEATTELKMQQNVAVGLNRCMSLMKASAYSGMGKGLPRGRLHLLSQSGAPAWVHHKHSSNSNASPSANQTQLFSTSVTLAFSVISTPFSCNKFITQKCCLRGCQNWFELTSTSKAPTPSPQADLTGTFEEIISLFLRWIAAMYCQCLQRSLKRLSMHVCSRKCNLDPGVDMQSWDVLRTSAICRFCKKLLVSICT